MNLEAVFRAMLVLVSITLFVDNVHAQTAVVPGIGHVEARMFLNKSATWSDNVLDAKADALRNTIAGPAASNTVLVVVEITGAPGGTYNGFFGPKSKYAVHLTARETGRNVKLLDQSQVIPVLDDQGKAYVAFLLHPQGCKPVQLIARITGQGAGKPVEKSLDFSCGE
jgi:hypothetical protein